MSPVVVETCSWQLMGYRISDDYKKPALQQLQHFAELSELREKDSLDTFFF